MPLQTGQYYLFVKGWAANAECVQVCRDAAAQNPKRQCVVIPTAAEWDTNPDQLPPASGPGCAVVVAGCEGHPTASIECPRCTSFWVNKAFLEAAAGC